MSGLEIVVSADGLNWIYLVLLYATIGGIAYRWPIPRLTPNAQKLAAVFLIGQILVIFVSQTIETTSSFEARLWDLHREWNIPSTLAFTQLATVGAVSILLGWIARDKSNWQRIYLAALGLLFLFLSVDEYFKVHETIDHWHYKYAAAGIMVALITAIVALRSSAPARKWYACLLIGLAISAMGAILLELVYPPCDSLAFLRFPGCFQLNVWEEAAEFLGIWLTLVAMLGFFSELQPPPSLNMRRVLLSLPLISLLLLLLNATLPSLELPLLARKALVEFEHGVRLRGYRLDDRAANSGWISVRLYLSAKQKDYLWLGYSIHLVDQINGNSVASSDSPVDRQHSIWPLGADYEQVYRQMMNVSIPPGTVYNRAYWVVLTFWRPRGEGYVAQNVRFSDHRLLSDTQVLLGEIVLQDSSSASADSALAIFDIGFALVGADLPDTAKAGEDLGITFTWRADSPSNADYIQFLHLRHEESGEWFVYDQNPLGPRLPTRLWYSGLADSETWQVPMPADVATGRYMVYTGLYHARDQVRLPARGVDGSLFLDARVPLGRSIIINER